jgi:uncharacterized protein (TIGR03067 family)
MDGGDEPPATGKRTPPAWVAVLAGVVVAAAIAGGLVWAGLAAAPVPKPDAEQIVGRWKFVDVILDADGTRPPNGPMSSVWEVREDGTFTATTPRLNTQEGTITLDPTASPKAFEIVGAKDGHRMPGLYALERDRLTLCLCFKDGGGRPTELRANAESGTHVWVFERVKGEK